MALSVTRLTGSKSGLGLPLFEEKVPFAHGVFFAGMFWPFWCRVRPVTLPVASR